MAVDTAAKRKSALLEDYGPTLLPDGAISSGVDRANMDEHYFAAPVVTTSLVAPHPRYGRVFLRR